MPKWALALRDKQLDIEERVLQLENSASAMSADVLAMTNELTLRKDAKTSETAGSAADGNITTPWKIQIEQSIEKIEQKMQDLPATQACGGASTSSAAHGDSTSVALRGLEGSDADRLDAAITALARETKAAEGAIAQALKLLQAQVMSKAARTELQHGLSRAMDAAFDAQERSRAVASSLVSIATDVDTRAPIDAVVRLESILHSQLSSSGGGGGPLIASRRIMHDNRGSPLHPTHCLSCKQPLPYTSHGHGGGDPAPPHEPLHHQAASRPSSSGRLSPPISPMRSPTRSGDASPLADTSPKTDFGAASGYVALSGRSFHTSGSLRRDGTDMHRNAKLIYGVPPANETRRKTALQLQMLGGYSGPGSTVRAGSAKGERKPIEAIVGRPTSAAALLPGQGRHAMRGSASAGSLQPGASMRVMRGAP